MKIQCGDCRACGGIRGLNGNEENIRKIKKEKHNPSKITNRPITFIKDLENS